MCTASNHATPGKSCRDMPFLHIMADVSQLASVHFREMLINAKNPSR